MSAARLREFMLGAAEQGPDYDGDLSAKTESSPAMTDTVLIAALTDALAQLFTEASELGEHKFTFKTITDVRVALRAAGRLP